MGGRMAWNAHEQLERLGRAGTEFGRQALADAQAVGKQVVEVGLDDAPGKRGRPLGER